jgi:hypothetical protein
LRDTSSCPDLRWVRDSLLLVELGNQGLPGFVLASLLVWAKTKAPEKSAAFVYYTNAFKEERCMPSTAHSDAIERARQLRHPKALQEHSGWSSPYMNQSQNSALSYGPNVGISFK